LNVATSMSIGQNPPANDQRQPLVSVGIPTFNRPEGLRHTLCQILAQTHRNLEVIVSDNASPDPQVEQVVREIAERDERVRYVRQPHNIGPMANFQFVLRHATGDYFMWAADDDEWSTFFVEKCLQACVNEESVGCGFETLFRLTGTREANPVPALDPEKGVLANIGAFFDCMQPSLIYGLHRRATLQYFHNLPTFDFVDCYFVLHQILGPGVRTISDVLYTAGIAAATYEIKHTDAQSKQLDYATFYVRTAMMFLRSRSLSVRQKYKAFKMLKHNLCGVIKHHEKCDDPRSILSGQVRRLALRAVRPRRAV
jgi:glycosyltransferase involved in cell wall biosynthesis